jgi:hypothetical protein
MKVWNFLKRLVVKMFAVKFYLYEVKKNNNYIWQGYGYWIGGAQLIVYDDALKAHYLMTHECRQLSKQKYFLFEGKFVAV